MFKVIQKLVVPIVCTSILFGSTTFAKTRYEAPNNSEFKSFMNYRTITDTTSRQYKIQQDAITLPSGFRVYNGCYTVAIGTGYDADVGDYVDVELDTGVVLHCIVGDIKQDIHTDVTNRQVTINGNVVEFIVDTKQVAAVAKQAGSVATLDGYGGMLHS